jgi:hypothetical protein
MIYIYHHLGLGDHIICNGLVRSLIKNNLEYTLFVRPQYLNSVKYMYNDLTNLSFKEGCDNSINNFLYSIDVHNQIRIGFIQAPENYSWDEYFYIQKNISFINRWEMFKIDRDFYKEDELLNKLNPENSKFALIHNAGSDGNDRIDYSKIDPTLKIIKVSPEHTDNIFSYLGLVYRAEEIHCVESCFNVLVDSLDVNTKLFYHKNHNRRSVEKNQHKLKKQWIIV